MRITEDAKSATRQRILQSAQRLFKENGFEKTTTRDITQAAKIATGTLFNYFLTKEDIAVTLVADALNQAHTAFEKQRAQELRSKRICSHLLQLACASSNPTANSSRRCWKPR